MLTLTTSGECNGVQINIQQNFDFSRNFFSGSIVGLGERCGGGVVAVGDCASFIPESQGTPDGVLTDCLHSPLGRVERQREEGARAAAITIKTSPR